jgi:hypothetical protein
MAVKVFATNFPLGIQSFHQLYEAHKHVVIFYFYFHKNNAVIYRAIKPKNLYLPSTAVSVFSKGVESRVIICILPLIFINNFLRGPLCFPLATHKHPFSIVASSKATQKPTADSGLV